MVALQNTGEGGTNTTAVTTGNSGGASGNAWDVVSTGGTGSITYDNTHARGSLAYKLVGDTASVQYLTRTTSIGTLGEAWGRFYLYMTALPASALGLVRVRVAGVQSMRLQMNTAGQIEVRKNSGNTQIGSVATACATGQFVRVEWHLKATTTNAALECRLYNTADSTTPTDSFSSTTETLTSANFDEINLGHHNATTPGTIWIDDTAVSTNGWIGPSVAALDQAIETDTAQTLTPANTGTVLIDQAVETDTAQTLTPIQPLVVALPQAVETDTAQTLTPVLAVPVGDLPFNVKVGGEVMRVTGIEPAGWDTFARTVSNGWGTSGSGHAWQTAGGAASDRSVSGTEGVITLPSSPTTIRQQWVDEDLTDASVLVALTPSQLATGASLQAGVLLRLVSSSAYYLVRAQLKTDGTIDLVALAPVTTLTGATATGQGTAAALDYLVASNADAADVPIGSLVKLYDITGALKEATVFTVVSLPSEFGFTNITVFPNFQQLTETGDQLRVVTAAATQLGATETTRKVYGAASKVWLRARITGQRIQGRIWRDDAEAEPAAWQIDRQVTTDLLTVGGAGVSASAAAGNTNVSPAVAFDDWEIYNPQRVTVQRAVNGVTKAHEAGAALSLAQPAVIGL